MESEIYYNPKKEKTKHLLFVGMALVVVVWSSINPSNRLWWCLLLLPPLTYTSVLAITYNRFRFTTFAYFMVFLHVILLLIGAKYTYTYNPLFTELKEMFNLSRNHYDRLGHFAQGFTPFLLTKEVILRNGYMKKGKFFYLTVFCFVLAVTATYEILEFMMTNILGETADRILDPQGDVWDTQWDMTLALFGGVCAQVIFGKYHERKIEEMN